MDNSINGTKQLPVFVFGVPRSGTTLITRFIRASPNVGGLNARLEWMAAQSWLPIEFARFFAKWLPSRRPSNGGRLWDQALKNQDYFFFDRLQQLMLSQNPAKKIWIAKKISNVAYIENILELFPQSTLLIIQRDPVETILSIQDQRIKKFNDVNIRWGVFLEDTSEQNPDPIIDCAHQFLSIYQKIDRHTISFNRVVYIGYREFCYDPRSVFRKLNPLVGQVMYPDNWSEIIKPQSRTATSGDIAKIKTVLGESLFYKLSGK